MNCRVVGARQSFQIFRQNTLLLENNSALSKFLHGVLHYLISIIKLKQNQSIKKWFYINHASHLKQFYCGYVCDPTANNESMYTKLGTEDDDEGASKYH